MGSSQKDLAKQALSKALEVRRKLNLDLKSPLCIYDVCKELGLTVQFAALSGIAGMYLNEEREKRILVSSLRPLPRKNYTCGHELGHNLFGHGSKIDEMEEAAKSCQRDPQEFLVDCFAGFLLMPKIAILNAFNSRGWTPATSTPRQIFTISCSFGVGYETLIDHMTYTLQLITEVKAKDLKKSSPKTVRQELFQGSSNFMMLVDKHWLLKTIDIEVGYQLLLPQTAQIEGDIISFQAEIQEGRLFQADRQGIARAYCPDSDWAAFIRVSRFNYIGFSEFRHTEESDDE